MTFSDEQMISSENSLFQLGGESNTLTFGNGATLSKGTKIIGGFNEISSVGDLVLGENSEIGISYNSLSGVRGSIDITGSLIATNSGSKIRASGISDRPSGNYQVVTATAPSDFGANDVHDLLDVDFGWLTMIDTNATDISSGINVTWEYNSLTNSTLADLGECHHQYRQHDYRTD